MELSEIGLEASYIQLDNRLTKLFRANYRLSVLLGESFYSRGLFVKLLSTSSSCYKWGTAEKVCFSQNIYGDARRTVLHHLHAQYSAERGQQSWHNDLEVDL
ncbi:uncharacterized protein LOC114310046 [Camellia sinensis]|uniref:uncharacterized protein LOC114310046 n=1 Tax=Camellia sinensis TaxID=4442 RepID=UPI00103637C7|nr:uncharacterized protein LOC114310046 [Camellia sinensis]